jgi:hypothetical protein
MNITDNRLCAMKIKADNLILDLVGSENKDVGLLGSPAVVTPKLTIYNKASLIQKIQHWVVITLSIGSLIYYAASLISSFQNSFTPANWTCIMKCTHCWTIFIKHHEILNHY